MKKILRVMLVAMGAMVSQFPAAAVEVTGGSSVERPPADSKPDEPAKVKPPEAAESRLPVGVTYTNKGLTFDTGDGKFAATMQHRLQFRYAYPFDVDPRSIQNLNAEGHSFMVRRARFKLNGHTFKPWLKYTFQYDWAQPILRDFWISVERFSWLTLRVGRGKVIYNDERVASSGQQQFVNRSIVNDVFTVDRQQGLQLMGRVLPNTAADFNYVVGVFAGRGVGERLNDDTSMMYAARLQWNAIGDPIDFSQSDYKSTPRWQLNIAAGAVTNKSNCTAFETDAASCRSLPGSTYAVTVGPAVTATTVSPGQFRVDQAVFEVRSVYRGLYLKHETHLKRVTDQGPATPTLWPREAEMWGALVQLGYFPHNAFDFMPAELEVAGRCAFVDPNFAVAGNDQYEYTGILNWFGNGHRNKLSFEITHHVLQNPAGYFATEQRYRSQWEFSF